MAEAKKTPVFINEIHYRNIGVDINEGVEIAGPAGTKVQGWSVHFYNKSGKPYGAGIQLTGVIPNQQNGFGTVYTAKKGIVDDAGGVALVDAAKRVVQFLSYGQTIAAVEGPAAGVTSEVLPVQEGFFNSANSSIQLKGKGSYYEDFTWTIQTQSRGGVNRGQEFVPVRSTRSPTAPPPDPVPGTTPPAQPPQPVPGPSNKDIYVDVLTAANRAAHNTSKYSGEGLIIRRGQEFSIEVTGAALSAQAFKVTLTIHPEEQSFDIEVKDTAGDKSKAYAYYASKTDSSVKINVYTPGDVAIGQYSLFVDAEGVLATESPDPLVILFNPWSPQDTVFLDNDAWRNEYVLNEQGLIWRGSANNNRPVAWNFAQFQSKALNSALLLLNSLDIGERSDPVAVSRRFTVLENDKVLYGNWSGKYDGGSEPTTWTGSKEILNQFWQTRQPVKWGQCWVFSGVLTSLMRTLGIPCRSVTNFESAHDTNGNRKVDKYFKIDGTSDSAKTDDSVWNFHVWNDAWFARPDLADKKFNGWQAIDATPQEQSEGAYQCGPCPLIAIKEGTKVDYDWTFIYGEVNADIYQYVATKTGDYKQVSVQTDAVGFQMSTKAVGRNEREDVTLQYKFAEGSKEERSSFNALEAQKELQVSGRLIVEDSYVGQPINITIRLASNKPQEGAKPAKIILTGTIVYYDGKQGDQIVNITKEVPLPADGSDVDLGLEITEDQYLAYLKHNHVIDWRVFVYSDSDADVDLLLHKRFSFQENEPVISIPDQVAADAKGTFKVSFKNPLSVPLTNAEFAVEGSGVVFLQRSAKQTISPGDTAVATFELKEGKKVGNRVVKAQISSTELETITTFKEVKVV